MKADLDFVIFWVTLVNTGTIFCIVMMLWGINSFKMAKDLREYLLTHFKLKGTFMFVTVLNRIICFQHFTQGYVG